MQLSLKLSVFVTVLLAQAAETPFAPANADDRITPSHFQGSSFSLASQNEAHPSTFSCDVDDPAFFELIGPYTRYSLNDLPDDSLFDARRAIWETDIRRHSAAVRLYGGRNICWIGGRILAHGARQNAESSKPSSNAGMVIKTGPSSTTVAVNGLKIDETLNGINIQGSVDRIILSDTEMSHLGGTCINLDSFQVAVVRNSLFDGCGRLLLLRRQSENIANELRLEGNVIRINMSESVIDGSEGYNSIFAFIQSESRDVSIKLYDNVILFEGDYGIIANYISNNLLEGVIECANNVFIVPEGDQPQSSNSDCGSITDDREIWEGARKAWMDRHSGDASGSNLGRVSPNGTLDAFIAEARADALDNGRSRGSEGVDGTSADLSFHVLDANGAPDVVAESRRSTAQAIGRAQEAAAAMASFLGRWVDGTFWHDGTGWVE